MAASADGSGGNRASLEASLTTSPMADFAATDSAERPGTYSGMTSRAGRVRIMPSLLHHTVTASPLGGPAGIRLGPPRSPTAAALLLHRAARGGETARAGGDRVRRVAVRSTLRERGRRLRAGHRDAQRRWREEGVRLVVHKRDGPRRAGRDRIP